MRLPIEMNLSPEWVNVFTQNGWEAVHRSTVGDPRARDRDIMEWAQSNGYIIFTHDLDFGAILAISKAEGPSVIQVRTQDVTPAHLQKIIIAAVKQYNDQLEEGALIIIDEERLRARILPINRSI